VAGEERELALSLSDSRLKKVLAYPSGDSRFATMRAVELRLLGVEKVILAGRLEICGLRVIGKGTNSVTFLGLHPRYGLVLVKCLRLDSSRESLLREALIMLRVNKLGLRPKLYCYSASFIVREYIEGIEFGRWIEKASSANLSLGLSKLLDKLYLLDKAGISHGELARPGDHILVEKEAEPVIIDFESASLSKRKRNLTQFLQYVLFSKRRVFESRLGVTIDPGRILPLLRKYKRHPSHSLVLSIKQELGLV